MGGSTSRYVFLIRHGERADGVEEPGPNDNIFDPLLTAKGLTQAKTTGVFLKEKLTEIEE